MAWVRGNHKLNTMTKANQPSVEWQTKQGGPPNLQLCVQVAGLLLLLLKLALEPDSFLAGSCCSRPRHHLRLAQAYLCMQISQACRLQILWKEYSKLLDAWLRHA